MTKLYSLCSIGAGKHCRAFDDLLELLEEGTVCHKLDEVQTFYLHEQSKLHAQQSRYA